MESLKEEVKPPPEHYVFRLEPYAKSPGLRVSDAPVDQRAYFSGGPCAVIETGPVVGSGRFRRQHIGVLAKGTREMCEAFIAAFDSAAARDRSSAWLSARMELIRAGSQVTVLERVSTNLEGDGGAWFPLYELRAWVSDGESQPWPIIGTTGNASLAVRAARILAEKLGATSLSGSFEVCLPPGKPSVDGRRQRYRAGRHFTMEPQVLADLPPEVAMDPVLAIRALPKASEGGP